MYSIIYWQQLTFRRALPSAMSASSPRPLSSHSHCFHPRGIVSPDTSPHRHSLSLSLSRLSDAVFLSSRLFTLARVFFPWIWQYTMSPVLSPLARALTFSSRLSSPVVTNKSKLSPAEKNARRFPEQRKAGFLGVICGDRSLNSTRSGNESVSRKYPAGTHGPMWTDVPTTRRRCLSAIASASHCFNRASKSDRVFILTPILFS